MEGVFPTRPQEDAPTRLAQLHTFEQSAIARWNVRTADLPADVAAKFPHGHLDVGIAIDGPFEVQSLSRLRETIQAAVRNHSGWPPFLTLTRRPFETLPVNGAVEFWRGPDLDGSFDNPVHHDFWRISPEGLLFTRTGYREDGGWDIQAGKFFDLSSPTWRVGETILEGAYIAKALNAADANLIIHCRWTGLAARELISKGNQNRMIGDGYRTVQDEYDVTKTVALNAIPEFFAGSCILHFSASLRIVWLLQIAKAPGRRGVGKTARRPI
jgi:hypothetical protein